MLNVSRYLYIIMRMNIAADSLMERFLQYLLDHPERFARPQVPCCLQGLWEEAMEQQSPAFDSTSPERVSRCGCTRTHSSDTSLVH